ncbi:MAG: hypothetical protein U0Y10_26450 [Spirosomataceae bacterium]
MKTTFSLQLTLLAGLLSFSTSWAQDVKPIVPRKHFTFYLTPVGFQITDIQQMNNLLTTNGYVPLTNTHYLLGAGFVFRYPNRALMICDFNFGNVPNTRFGQKTNANLYGLCIGFGYEVIKNKRVSSFPYAGFGSSSLHVNASKNDISANQFNNYLSADPDGILFRAFAANVKIGWQFDYSLPLPKTDGKKIAVALNVGYSLPISTRWAQRNGQPLENVPDVNVGGFYSKFMIGL